MSKETAEAKAARLAAEAEAAKEKAADHRTADEKRADELVKKADDARAAAAAQASKDEGTTETVGDTAALDAGNNLPANQPDDTPAGAVRSSKRGNDPANPEYASGISQDPKDQTVKLTRTTPDSPEPVVTWVHPDMVGNYIRAGWSVGG